MVALVSLAILACNEAPVSSPPELAVAALPATGTVKQADSSGSATGLIPVADDIDNGSIRFAGGSGQVWVACEAHAVRGIRADLLGGRGMPSGRVLTRGYWRAGHSNHPDHDYGDDSL